MASARVESPVPNESSSATAATTAKNRYLNALHNSPTDLGRAKVLLHHSPARAREAYNRQQPPPPPPPDLPTSTRNSGGGGNSRIVARWEAAAAGEEFPEDIVDENLVMPPLTIVKKSPVVTAEASEEKEPPPIKLPPRPSSGRVVDRWNAAAAGETFPEEGEEEEEEEEIATAFATAKSKVVAEGRPVTSPFAHNNTANTRPFFVTNPPPTPPKTTPEKQRSSPSWNKKRKDLVVQTTDNRAASPQLVHQKKQWNAQSDIPSGKVRDSPFTPAVQEPPSPPPQLSHQKKQWDATRDIPRGKVSDSPMRAPSPPLQSSSAGRAPSPIVSANPGTTAFSAVATGGKNHQWDPSADIPSGTVQHSPFKESKPKQQQQASPQLVHKMNQWDAKKDIPQGAVSDRVRDPSSMPPPPPPPLQDSPSDRTDKEPSVVSDSTTDTAVTKKQWGGSKNKFLNKARKAAAVSPSKNSSETPPAVGSAASPQVKQGQQFFKEVSAVPANEAVVEEQHPELVHSTKQWDAKKEIPAGRVSGMSSLFAAKSPTGKEVAPLPQSREPSPRQGPDKLGFPSLDQHFAATAPTSNMPLSPDAISNTTGETDPWVVPTTPSGQLFHTDNEAAWGKNAVLSASKSDDSQEDWGRSMTNDDDESKDWFPSESFGSNSVDENSVEQNKKGDLLPGMAEQDDEEEAVLFEDPVFEDGEPPVEPQTSPMLVEEKSPVEQTPKKKEKEQTFVQAESVPVEEKPEKPDLAPVEDKKLVLDDVPSGESPSTVIIGSPAHQSDDSPEFDKAVAENKGVVAVEDKRKRRGFFKFFSKKKSLDTGIKSSKNEKQTKARSTRSSFRKNAASKESSQREDAPPLKPKNEPKTSDVVSSENTENVHGPKVTDVDETKENSPVRGHASNVLSYAKSDGGDTAISEMTNPTLDSGPDQPVGDKQADDIETTSLEGKQLQQLPREAAQKENEFMAVETASPQMKDTAAVDPFDITSPVFASAFGVSGTRSKPSSNEQGYPFSDPFFSPEPETSSADAAAKEKPGSFSPVAAEDSDPPIAVLESDEDDDAPDPELELFSSDEEDNAVTTESRSLPSEVAAVPQLSEQTTYEDGGTMKQHAQPLPSKATAVRSQTKKPSIHRESPLPFDEKRKSSDSASNSAAPDGNLIRKSGGSEAAQSVPSSSRLRPAPAPTNLTSMLSKKRQEVRKQRTKLSTAGAVGPAKKSDDKDELVSNPSDELVAEAKSAAPEAAISASTYMRRSTRQTESRAKTQERGQHTYASREIEQPQKFDAKGEVRSQSDKESNEISDLEASRVSNVAAVVEKSAMSKSALLDRANARKRTDKVTRELDHASGHEALPNRETSLVGESVGSSESRQAKELRSILKKPCRGLSAKSTPTVVTDNPYGTFGTNVTDPVHLAGLRLLAAAVIPIQAMIRRFLAERKALNRMFGLLMIQAYMRRWLAEKTRREIINNRNHLSASVMIQAYMRRWQAERHLKTSINSAVKIQAGFRGWLDRDKLDDEHFCATQIQRVVRGYLATMAVYEDIYKVTMVQSYVRMKLAVEEAIYRMAFVIQLQSIIRGYLVRRQLGKINDGATAIQRVWRGHRAKLDYQFDLLDIIIVQSVCRRRKARQIMAKKRQTSEDYYATKIQAQWRSYDCSMNYLHYMADVLIVQSAIRRWLASREVKRYRTMVENESSIVIQRTTRSYLTRRQLRETFAAIEIQRTWRGFVSYADYMFTVADIVIVQTRARQWLAKRKLVALEEEHRALEEQRLALEKKRLAREERRKGAAATVVQRTWRGYAVREECLLKLVSVILCQSAVRRFLAVKRRQEKFEQRQERAATSIQSRWRCFWHFSNFVIMLDSAIRIQALTRSYLTRCESEKRQESATIIQSCCRSFIVRNMINRRYMVAALTVKSSAIGQPEAKAATTIQKTVRGGQASYAFKSYLAAREIQCIWRGHKPFKTYTRYRAALIIQRAWRGKSAYHAYREMVTRHRAAIRIQTAWRRFHCYTTYTYFMSALRIQTVWRGHKCFSHYQRTNSAVRIQKAWRGFVCYTDYIFTVSDIVAAQRVARRYLARKKASELMYERDSQNAAIQLQRVCRGHMDRKKCAILMEQEKERRLRYDSATSVQSQWRKYQSQMRYWELLFLVVQIQKHMRGYLARRRVAEEVYEEYQRCVVENDAATKIQSCARRQQAYREYQQKRFILMLIMSESTETRSKAAATTIQAWWRENMRRRNEPAAAIVIQRFFLSVKAEVDRAVKQQAKKRRKKKKKKKRVKRAKETDDEMLDRIWDKTIEKTEKETEEIHRAEQAAANELNGGCRHPREKSPGSPYRRTADDSLSEDPLARTEQNRKGQMESRRESHSRQQQQPPLPPTYNDGAPPTDLVRVVPETSRNPSMRHTDERSADEQSEVSGLTNASLQFSTKVPPSRLNTLSTADLAEDFSLEEAWIDTNIYHIREKRRASSAQRPQRRAERNGRPRRLQSSSPGRQSRHHRHRSGS